MDGLSFADRLEPLGLFAGGLLVLMAAGTAIGTPWTTSNSALASGLQILGIGVLLVLGVGLAWLSYEG